MKQSQLISQSPRLYVSIEKVRIAGVKMYKMGSDVDVPKADYSRSRGVIPR